MYHQFNSPDGPVDVTVMKPGDEWILGEQKAVLERDGRVQVHLANGESGYATVAKVADHWWVHFSGHTFNFERIEPGATQGGNDGGLTAPMPGKVLDVLVEVGQSVVTGQTLMILEAMKMEHRILAAASGTVTDVYFSTGEQVQQGSVLLAMTEHED